MPLTTSIIETGVDRLVKLVKVSGKISLPDAAKQLGVSPTVIEEWADFLEEEGIISIEHSLTKTYLVQRKLTKKEVEGKAKEFKGKKDIFIRKAEGASNFLEKEASKLKDVKAEFDILKDELGFDLSTVGKELNELHRYEQLKINLDKQVHQQKKIATEKLNELSNSILKEHNKYEQLLMDLKNEESQLKKERIEAISIEESEKILKKKLSGIKSLITKLEQRIGLEEETITNSQTHINKLYNLSNQIREKTIKEKNLIEPLVEKSKAHEKRILAIQDKILLKISEKEQKLQKAKKVSFKFKKFFDKKMQVITLIDKLNQDKDILEKDLIELIKKAKSFQLTSKSKDLGKEILDIENKFKKVDHKKKDFEQKFKKLSKALKE